MPRRCKPEIMSPAGHWPQMRAAIEAGADAVYFGLNHFSARAKVGFTLAELPEAMRTLHQRGVRGYITFNTLIFEHELAEAARTIAAIAEAGADAMIMQDYAAVRMAREIVPEMELHASTQMSISNADGVRFAQSFGIQRVTLARELSLDEVRTIIDATGCDLEIFVHGALCVAYSGQCFSSEAWGGRSANRGQCAQACRLPYQMIVDGRLKPLADARYLLSPGDLYALEQVPQIVEIGVAAMKIEGRYKDAEYVALTTQAYRKAVDAAWSSQDRSSPNVAGSNSAVTAREKLQLEQVYSRGLGPFFMTGTNHQTVVDGRAPRHRGVRMGRVSRVEPDRVFIETAEAHALAPLKPGDGVVFDSADWRSPEEPEEGGRVYEVCTSGGAASNVTLHFANGAVRFDRIRAGDLVWRTHDPDLDRAAKPFIDAPSPVAKQPVAIRVIAKEGGPLEAEWSLVKRPEYSVVVKSATALEPAQNHGLSIDSLRDQFGRLGNTPYELAGLSDVTLEITGTPFAPVSMLNQMRREAVEQLQELQGARPAVTIRSARIPTTPLVGRTRDARAVPSSAPDPRSGSHNLLKTEPDGGVGLRYRGTALHDTTPQLHLLVRTPEQLDAAITLAPASITLDYLDLFGLRPSVGQIKSAGLVARVASPRVLKPGEERILNFLASLDCAILVRSASMIQPLLARLHSNPARKGGDSGRDSRGDPHGDSGLIGDFSLNVANSITAESYLALGLARLTPTHDLNAAQIAALARTSGADQIEAIAYQHLPVFHTEYCVFCRFLSSGTSYRDCGRPCEKHRVELKDSNGRAHPVMADVGCRNTVFGAEAQEASAHLNDWLRAGIRHFRLEFVHESGEEVSEIARLFRKALTAEITSQELSTKLRKAAPQGITEGSLFISKDYLQLPILQ
jgi:putative protease